MLLLALTDLDASNPARLALSAVGVTSQRLMAEIRTTGDDGEWSGSMTFSLAFYTLSGLAQGFALTLGDGSISPEHVLLAILWTGNSSSLPVLDRLGVTREAVVEQLRGLGVDVPVAAFPPVVRVDVGEKVYFARDEVQRVVRFIGQRLGPGEWWGFNFEGDRAWVQGEQSTSLEGLVRQALAKPE